MKKLILLILVVFICITSYTYYSEAIAQKKPVLVTFDESLSKSDLSAPVLSARTDKNRKIELNWKVSQNPLTVKKGIAPEYVNRSGFRIYRDGVWYKDVPLTNQFVDELALPGENYSYQVSTLTFDNKIEGQLSKEVTLVVSGNIETLNPPKKKIDTTLVEGDSVSYGVGVGPVNWPNLVAGKFSDTKVVNRSEVGAFSADVAKRINGDLQDVQPDVVIVAIGTNDIWAGSDSENGNISLASFLDNIKSIVTTIKTSDALPVLINLHPLAGVEAKRAAWNKALRDLSYNEGVLLIDVSSKLEESGGESLLEDSLHPGPIGHKIMADEIAQSLSTIKEE